ncbi:hypothetical protein CPB86DRAFT_801234 [Serendipita vermifera]|nr:hypothetical protein CPB86DRAFT_801234 [Serendipita vermifera]
MFRTSSRQPVQVVAPAPPIVMSSQPIYIPAPKASSSGMNQPYTILVGSHGGSRRAPIEIVVGSSSSTRRDDHPIQPMRERRHSTTHYHQSTSYEQPKIIVSSSPSGSSSKHHRSTSASVASAPRSDVATYGGSVYSDRSKAYSSSSSSHDSHPGHHRDDHHYHSHGHSDSKRDRRNSVSVVPQSTTTTRHHTHSGSGDYLRPPTATTQPIKIPSSSPQKQTRFAALPQSVPTKPVALPVVSSHSAPIQVASSYPVTNTVARPHGHHRSSHSHDLTLYATRPRHSPPLGWFNRRGDEYLVESGLVRKADSSTKWHAVFNDYPEPGTGWMDHEKRFIPASGGILKH